MYHITVRTPTRETPFSLTFGTEALILIEIGMTMHRAANFDSEKNKESLRLNLDLLAEKRDEAVLLTSANKQRMTKYYNS